MVNQNKILSFKIKCQANNIFLHDAARTVDPQVMFLPDEGSTSLFLPYTFYPLHNFSVFTLHLLSTPLIYSYF